MEEEDIGNLSLEEYIKKDSKYPVPADTTKPTDDEMKAAKQWRTGDAKA
jgi:hypothetical protein